MESKKNQQKDSVYLIDKDSKEPIPLTSILFEGDILSCLASFKMHQFYHNLEDFDIETLFLFPTDVKVAISKITVLFTKVDGSQHELETVIDERKKIEVKYEDAVASGKTAVMGSFSAT